MATWCVVGAYLLVRLLFSWYAWRKLRRGCESPALWRVALFMPFGWIALLFDGFMRELDDA